MSSSRRVVVTGGAGFIGSHLTERLLGDGHRVVVLDNFSTGSLEKLAHLQADPGLTVDSLDVSDEASIRTHFEDADWVFHLAALADIVPSIKQPLAYHKANVDSTVTVLEAARCAGVSRFIYTASSSCYGIPDQFPTPEEAAIRPMYPYALTKYLGEQYVLHWNKVYKLPSVSLRLFNVYGPRARSSGAYGAVFGVFLAQKMAGKPFTIVGDGTQSRDFTFVTDVVEALVLAAKSDAEGEVFNVGSGRSHSINHLVSLLGGDVVYVPKRPGEPDCTFADIKKISRTLEWRPKVEFPQGVKALMENMDEWSGAPIWNEQSIEVATREWFAYLGSAD